MPILTTGIPSLPDLTHPSELIQFGTNVLKGSLLLVLLVIALGIAITILSYSLRRDEEQYRTIIGEWAQNYSRLLLGLQHLTLILILVVTGFLLCTTLSNRYHHWEQARVAQVQERVSGDRLEQIAPQIRYVIKEPYSYTTQVNNKIVKVTEKRDANRFLTLSGSQIQVQLDQTPDVQNRRAVYRVDYSADYKVTNSLSDVSDFFFEAPPPNGYSLLSSYKIERAGSRLEQKNPGDYGFPFQLQPGQETSFRITYKAQGGSRWIYSAEGQLLNNFRLTTIAKFRDADFASGIVPNAIEPHSDGGTKFTWTFDDNVSVKNPFGVFTNTNPIRHTGVLPRLLLLAPGIFLWWILLLYLSIPISFRNLTIAAGIFFACILTLTYLSRIINPLFAWALASFVLLSLTSGISTNRRGWFAAVICTISGAIIPVFGLLIPFSGLTLSLAGLLSGVWLAVNHWYGRYRN